MLGWDLKERPPHMCARVGWKEGWYVCSKFFRIIKYCEVWPKTGGSEMVLGVDGGRAAREVMSCCDSLRAGREPVQDSALCTLWVYCAPQYILCV